MVGATFIRPRASIRGDRPQTMTVSKKHNIDERAALETSLGYRFKEPALLTLALTHSSHAHEKAGRKISSASSHCNERLEFLGDSVLGLAITNYLYDTFPDLPEGKLSVMKSRLVSGDVLGKIGRRLGLGQHILLGRGEEALGGRARKSILARALEAILGAVFLDGGQSRAQEATLRLFEQELGHIPSRIEQYDYKSQLQKLTQKLYGTVPRYDLVSQSGPDHGRVFRVRARMREQLFAVARGTSKKSAEQRAARLALRKMEK
jgi:ribonuclease III